MTTTVALDRDLYHLNHVICQWCEENFLKDTWDMSMMFGHQLYRFEHSTDAAVFALRWGGKAAEDD